MISTSDRENAVLLIDEAIKSGASCKKACERLGITERTFYRWKKRKCELPVNLRLKSIHPHKYWIFCGNIGEAVVVNTH